MTILRMPFTRKPGNSIRVLSANTWAAEDFRQERLDILSAAAEDVGADVVLLQEIERSARSLSGFTDRGYAVAALPSTDGWATAVVTKLPYRTMDPIPYTVPESPWAQIAANAIVTTPGGNEVLFVSVHLVHGGLKEHARLQQASILDRAVAAIVDPLGIPAVLGGDMNCRPDSSTARFLEGIEAYQHTTAQWTDAWGVSGSGSGYTSSPSNRWARVTSSVNGIHDPWLVPERRIDRILVRGWVYGKVMYPMGTYLLDQEYFDRVQAPYPPSDHWSVVADLVDVWA